MPIGAVGEQGMRFAPPSGSQLKTEASAGYNEALKSPISLQPETMGILKNNLKQNFYDSGITDADAPASFKKMDQYLPDQGGAVTPQNLRATQKAFGRIKNTSNDPTERMVSGQILNHFNNVLENLDKAPSALASGTPEDAAAFSQTVKDANANYSAYKQDQSFDLRGQKAENNTAAANSGLNLENNLHSQVRQVLNNPNLQRGYNDETLAAMHDFNMGSRTANTVRLVSNALGGGGGIGALISGGISSMLGLPFETGPGVGMALKAFGNAGAASKFNNIQEMIRANSPLARSGEGSLVPRKGILNALASRPNLFGLQTIPSISWPLPPNQT